MALPHYFYLSSKRKIYKILVGTSRYFLFILYKARLTYIWCECCHRRCECYNKRCVFPNIWCEGKTTNGAKNGNIWCESPYPLLILKKQRFVRVISRGYKKKQQIVRGFIWGFHPLKITFSASFAMDLVL